jgi:hypothetical protein
MHTGQREGNLGVVVLQRVGHASARERMRRDQRCIVAMVLAVASLAALQQFWRQLPVQAGAQLSLLADRRVAMHATVGIDAGTGAVAGFAIGSE